MKKLICFLAVLLTCSTYALNESYNLNSVEVAMPGEILWQANGKITVCTEKGGRPLVACNCGYDLGRTSVSFGPIIFYASEDESHRKKGARLCQDRAENSTQEMLMRASNCRYIN